MRLSHADIFVLAVTALALGGCSVAISMWFFG